MPVMSGYQAAAKIKAARPNLPVIALTGRAMPDEKERALSSGCTAYLAKPVKKSELLELLAGICPVSQAAIETGLESVALPGRCQFIAGAVETVLDVAHNPESAIQLGQCLQNRPVTGDTWLVLGTRELERGKWMQARSVRDPEGWLLLADIRATLLKYDKVRTIYRRVFDETQEMPLKMMAFMDKGTYRLQKSQ